MDSDRSLSSGLSIPEWMKSKMIDNRLDLDQSAFSPPGHDDNFLYIRYPRITGVNDRHIRGYVGDFPDLSKHTEPCRQSIEGAISIPPAPKQTSIVDDSLKNNHTDCGTSVVKVAQQIVSEKRSQQQYISIPTGFQPNIRRGSKSLPASPLSSPKSSPKAQRKLLSNHKYFTGAFVDGDRNTGWILSSLLSKREMISNSVSSLTEEDVSGSAMELTKPEEETRANKKSVATLVFQPRPSELREMNFWSPTSM